MNDSRVTISATTSSGNTYTSSLQFTYLMEGDEGTYTCNVMILDTSESQSVDIQLLTGELYHQLYLHFEKNLIKMAIHIVIRISKCMYYRDQLCVTVKLIHVVV